MGDLRKEVSKWCGVPTEDQRFTMEGLPLPWEVDLSCVGEGTGVSALEATRFDRSRKAAGSSFTVVLFYRRPISHTFDFHAHAREGVSLRVSPFLSNFIADARYNTYVGLAYLR